MRRIVFRWGWSDAGKWVDTIQVGMFHRWGYEHDQDSEDGQTTVAIVELADGRIVTPYPSQVTFIDPPGGMRTIEGRRRFAPRTRGLGVGA